MISWSVWGRRRRINDGLYQWMLMLARPRRVKTRAMRRHLHSRAMDRRSALVLLAVFGTGVFLAGLELMITAVALPSILDDLADPSGGSAWIELRKASWIINGYLLVYILTMPLAGRLTDLWGARRLFLGALVDLHRRARRWPALAQTLDQLIAARLVQAVGGGVLVPVGTAAASHLFGGAGAAAGARGHRRADVPRDGRRARSSARRSSRRSTPRTRSPAAGLGSRRWPTFLAPAWRWVFYINVPIGIVALAPGLGRVAAAGRRRAGRAGSTSSGAACSGSRSLTGLVGLTLIGTTRDRRQRRRTRRS